MRYDTTLGLQWSHDLSAMDTRTSTPPTKPTSSSFNGAMTSQPWILELCWGGGLGWQRLQWSHDLSAMDTPPFLRAGTVHSLSFNGAMTSQPWIQAAPTIRPVTAWRLQWSHDLSAMDTRHVIADLTERQLLQWSHDLSAMDTWSDRYRSNKTHHGFNGAMTSQPWIRRRLLQSYSAPLPASMEP